MAQKTIKVTNKKIDAWYKSYVKEFERQMQKPSMQQYADQLKYYSKKDKVKFAYNYAKFLQQRYVDLAENKRASVGNVMRDYVNDTKFDVSTKQAKALFKGLTKTDKWAEEFGIDVDNDLKSISTSFNKKVKGLSYGSKINLLRSDMYNIMNEDYGMISTLNDTLKQIGNEASNVLEKLFEENPLLSEDDPQVKELKELANFSDSYSRADYIGNRLFGSPD